MVAATRPFFPLLSQSRREQVLEAHIVQLEAEVERLRECDAGWVRGIRSAISSVRRYEYDAKDAADYLEDFFSDAVDESQDAGNSNGAGS